MRNYIDLISSFLSFDFCVRHPHQNGLHQVHRIQGFVLHRHICIIIILSSLAQPLCTCTQLRACRSGLVSEEGRGRWGGLRRPFDHHNDQNFHSGQNDHSDENLMEFVNFAISAMPADKLMLMINL